MKSITRALLITCLALPIIACGSQEAPQQAEAAPVTVPTTEDKAAWNAYLNDVAGRHMEGINSSPYVYLVPPAPAPAADAPPADAATADGGPALSTSVDGGYDRLREKAEQDLARGITRGNLLIFAGLESARTADLVIASFTPVGAGTMNGVRVLFIGAQADSERVRAVVEPTGSEYVFIDNAA